MSFVALVAVASLSFTGPQLTELASYKVNTDESVINWKGYKVTGQHYGTVMLKEGKLEYTDGMLTGGSFAIDMTSQTLKQCTRISCSCWKWARPGFA